MIGHSKTKSLFRDGMAPVVCTSTRPHWERLPPKSVYYYRSPRHDRQYVLSFPFCFERADETYFFAYCFPYTFSYLQRFLYALENRGMPYFRRETLCRTLQERKCDLLAISSPANLRLDAAIRHGHPMAPPPLDAHGGPLVRHVCFLSARVHPGETPASFVMHGLLLFLVSDHPKAKELREAAILLAVPMLNPDGVFVGNYRCNSVGLDLNRLWHASVAGTAPTVHAMREAARAYCAYADVCKLQMVVDIHAHSTCMNGFVFANMPDDPKAMDEVAAFPKVLGSHHKDFANGCKFDTDPNKAGTGRRALSEMLPGVHCYTLEVSMFTAAQGNVRTEAYLPSSYTDMGHAMGLALHEHLCTGKNGALNGSIAAAPPTPPASISAAATAPHRSTAAARQARPAGRAVVGGGGVVTSTGASAAANAAATEAPAARSDHAPHSTTRHHFQPGSGSAGAAHLRAGSAPPSTVMERARGSR